MQSEHTAVNSPLIKLFKLSNFLPGPWLMQTLSTSHPESLSGGWGQSCRCTSMKGHLRGRQSIPASENGNDLQKSQSIHPIL